MCYQIVKINILRPPNFPHIFLIVLFNNLLLNKVTMTDQKSHQNSIVGGWTEQNANDDNIKTLVSRSLAKINAESNDRLQLFPVDVISAHSQVVAGIQYKLRIMVGRSNCTKSQPIANLENCAESDQAARKIYLVSIWQKPWEHFEQITYQLEEMKNSVKQSE